MQASVFFIAPVSGSTGSWE